MAAARTVLPDPARFALTAFLAGHAERIAAEVAGLTEAEFVDWPNPGSFRGRWTEFPLQPGEHRDANCRAANPRSSRRLAMLQIPSASAAARRHMRTVRRWLAPAPANTLGSAVLLLGDANTLARDQVLPRLVQAATGLRVDARFVPTTFANREQVGRAYAG